MCLGTKNIRAKFRCETQVQKVTDVGLQGRIDASTKAESVKIHCLPTIGGTLFNLFDILNNRFELRRLPRCHFRHRLAGDSQVSSNCFCGDFFTRTCVDCFCRQLMFGI